MITHYEFEELAAQLAAPADHTVQQPVKCKFCHHNFDLATVRVFGHYNGSGTPHKTIETPCCHQMASVGGKHEDIIRMSKEVSIHASIYAG